ncbi:MAG TPA: Rrf2 family transcriptional regulator [Burkholderiaceae bacterium]|nr:Rrf2 family transcriptional regulator [Burkholderiaceae bacterium]
MRLTTKGRFAVTAVLDLAIHGADRPVKLSEISARQGISLSYLEQLFAQERRSGVVRSRRGPGGGYTLGRPASELSVADIIRAVDEPIDATQCGGAENCRDGHSKCLTHDLWDGLNDHILRYLQSVTLEQLVRANSSAGTTERVIAPPRTTRARPVAETEIAS